jgi:hypothetical protein
MKNENIKIIHAMNSNNNEYKIPNTNYRVDGFCVETNTIYEFLGCNFHGCIKCLSKDGFDNPYDKTKNNFEFYTDTFIRLSILKNLGYNIIFKWECEFDL